MTIGPRPLSSSRGATILLLLYVATLAALFVLSTIIPPKYLHAQLSPGQKEQLHENREINREMRREWNAEEWHRHNERFFGPGVVIERYPGEAYDLYVARIHAKCEAQWQGCSASCAGIPDPMIRAGCVASCNNNLYECNYGF